MEKGSTIVAILRVTAESYSRFLIAKPYAVILFDAAWDVGPGAEIRRSFESAAAAIAEHANFGEVNVDDELCLARQIPIINVPTVAYYRDGQLIKALIGANQDVAGRLSALIDGCEIGF